MNIENDIKDGTKEGRKEKRTNTGFLFSAVLSLSLFSNLSNSLMAEEIIKLKDKQIKEVQSVQLQKSTESKSEFPYPVSKFMRKTDKIPEEKTAWSTWADEVKKREKKVKSIISAFHVNGQKAKEILDSKCKQSKDREQFQFLINYLAEKEMDGDIIIFDRDLISSYEFDPDVTITYYPIDDAFIVYFLNNIRLVGDELIDPVLFEKGSYVIFDEKGMSLIKEKEGVKKEGKIE